MVCFSSPARAAFLFCNQTSSVIEAAFGHRDQGVWTSQGWWKIQPGQCARAYNKPLLQRFFFYYARALTLTSHKGKGSRVWGGKYPFCVDDKAFKIKGDDDCDKRHFRSQGFHEIDVGVRQEDYTLTFESKKALGN